MKKDTLNNDDRYIFVKMIDREKNVAMVKHQGTNFIRKVYETYSKNVFERLQVAEISGIPKIIELCEENQKLYIIEEYVEGKNILQLMEDKFFSEEETIVLVYELCDILKKLHELTPPMIHRDIKPSNIIRSRRGKYYLIDFNASKEVITWSNQDTHLFGTHYFGAPEQLLGYGPSDQTTDIYSLGATMNYIMSGMYAQQLIVPGRLHNIIAKCIKMDKENRYQSIDELLEALNNI